MTKPQAARETPEGERPCTHPFDRLYRRNGHIICDACGHFDPRMDAEHVAARETLRPDPLTPDPRCRLDGQPREGEWSCSCNEETEWESAEEHIARMAGRYVAALRAATEDRP